VRLMSQVAAVATRARRYELRALLLSVDAIVDSALAEGQLPGALRFPRSHAPADRETMWPRSRG
jgi:hypothetical protein